MPPFILGLYQQSRRSFSTNPKGLQKSKKRRSGSIIIPRFKLRFGHTSFEPTNDGTRKPRSGVAFGEPPLENAAWFLIYAFAEICDPNTPWDGHICRSIDPQNHPNVGIWHTWSVWVMYHRDLWKTTSFEHRLCFHQADLSLGCRARGESGRWCWARGLRTSNIDCSS